MDDRLPHTSKVTPQSMQSKDRTVKVWDIPTRIFHWSLVFVVAVAWVSSEADGGAFWIHVYAGTLLLGFVAFRAVWGMIGSRHAQFGDFVHGPEEVTSYTTRLMAFRPPYSLGHNPLGGWMIVAMIAVILLAVLTGMMSSEDGYVGPLAHIGGGLLGEAHEGFANFLLILIFVHVVGVFAHGALTRENLPRAMITGDKHVPSGVPGEDIKPVGMVRPLIALAIAVVVVLYFMR
ncbi:cytochrome b/b6 domain-containing protein [Magnetovibrio sp.]|uniref:cytochrome b/b6 domain-containing protein n=1 Tax=Magnetovibrio sp. TaxID=2024836 RepID=UPI002F956C85